MGLSALGTFLWMLNGCAMWLDEGSLPVTCFFCWHWNVMMMMMMMTTTMATTTVTNYDGDDDDEDEKD